jgi:uncharacterized FlaG/YvyC family protein
MNTNLTVSTSAAGSRDIAAVRVSPVKGIEAATGGTDVRLPGQSASEPLKREDVANAIAAFNDVFEQADVSVRYRIDENTSDLVISLVNSDTDEVIRQMPPDAILSMRQRLQELLGLIFDTTA